MLAAAGAPVVGVDPPRFGAGTRRRGPRRSVRDPRRRGARVARRRGRGRSGRRHRAERALAGPRRDLGRRAHGARRDGAAAAAARTRQLARSAESIGVVLGAVDARARSTRRRLASIVVGDAAARCSRSTRRSTRRALTRSALTGMVDAICRDSAASPRGPGAAAAHPHRDRRCRSVPRAARRQRVRRAGSPRRRDLGAASNAGAARSPVSTPGSSCSSTRPTTSDAWRLVVLASGRDSRDGGLVPIEQAIVDAGSERRDVEDEMARLERLLPPLMRPGGTRRGQVVLSQDEAWELMTVDRREVARRRLRRAGARAVASQAHARRCGCSPTSASSVVGANQLADVRWSALFDDVELTAADIARLAKEARPLIRSGGRWVAIDRADLNEAAAALAERSKKTQLSGGEMLRLALGLEGSTLAGGISIGGEGWAADLLAAASKLSSEPVDRARRVRRRAPQLPGRSARRGSASSTRVGLGGCLALDMGLGKTPTMLAQSARGCGYRSRARRSRRPRSSVTGPRKRAASRPSSASSCTTARTARRPTRSRTRSPTPTS